MSEKTAIFLGAGASAAEGASSQGSLFKDYFEMIKKRGGRRKDHEKELARFFDQMFGIKVNKRMEGIEFPTFEEALGILDLADQNNQSFRNFPLLNLTSNSGRINYLRIYLVFLMADILQEKLRRRARLHRELVNQLARFRKLKDIFFVTTNYDILCDNALLDQAERGREKINYGFDFVNSNQGFLARQGEESIKLFKIHGSLNWLFCPTCNNLRLTPYQKGVSDLITDPDQSGCPTCGTFYAPIIVPPTFYKNLSNVFLSQVWNKTEAHLLEAEHLVFCGYSFPDADIHVKYLIKRIQKNRKPGKPFKVSVVNNYDGKKEPAIKEEMYRYRRFLGGCVNYTKYSFEEFACNPSLLV